MQEKNKCTITAHKILVYGDLFMGSILPRSLG